MKSLLHTLPRAQTVEIWGARIRTNLKAVIDYSMADEKRGDKFLISLILDVFTDVEKFDLKVQRGSIFFRRKTLRVWMAPGPKFRKGLKANTGQSRANGVFLVSRCHFCEELVVEKGEQASQHRSSCPMVAAIEVMET